MNRTGIGVVVASAAAAIAMAIPGSASASVGVDNPTSFSSNGTLSIGWYWVHQDTESASWTFNIGSLASADKNSIYLNVDALVSNKPDGGSGYSARGVKFTASCGTAKQILKVQLVNPFRPQYPNDTFGTGQAASGHSSAPLKLKRFSGCTEITVKTSGAFPQDRAIGFKESSASLAFS